MSDEERCYVLSDLSGAPVLVGRLVRMAGVSATFEYAKSFLDSGSAFSLDPLNLPLKVGHQIFSSTPFMPGVLLDAGPDDWGRRALAFRNKPAEGVLPLVYGSGSGAGDLLFSYSRDQVKPRPTPPPLSELAAMLEGAADIEGGQPLPVHIAKLLDAGISMGGARPKAVVEDGGRLWLAKFPSSSDILDQPLVEFASLKLARMAGITVPDHRVERVAGRTVLLVERFDVRPTDGGEYDRLHYLSMAAALVVGKRLRADAVRGPISYMGMAALLTAVGRTPVQDKQELFSSMVFNVLIGHVDDHSRNHGFVMESASSGYRLSPAFDIAPSNGSAESVSRLRDVQAIGIGHDGATRSYSNLVSAAEDFGFAPDAAAAEVARLVRCVSEWRDVFQAAGVREADCNLLQRRILALDGLPIDTIQSLARQQNLWVNSGSGRAPRA